MASPAKYSEERKAGLTAHNQQAKSDALERMLAYRDEIVAQYLGAKEFDGVLDTLRRMAIPWGTYLYWQSKPEWQEIGQDIRKARRQFLNSFFDRAIYKGEGVNRIAYVVGALNRLDPEWSDKLEHSGQVGTFTVNVPGGMRDLAQVGKAEDVTEK